MIQLNVLNLRNLDDVNGTFLNKQDTFFVYENQQFTLIITSLLITIKNIIFIHLATVTLLFGYNRYLSYEELSFHCLPFSLLIN